MRPLSSHCSVRFGGAFLSHPDWRLNPSGQVELNAAATELTIMGDRGRGSQRRPVALRLPARYIVNLLVDDGSVQFRVRDRRDQLSAEPFTLHFDSPDDASTFAELLPQVWIHSESPSAHRDIASPSSSGEASRSLGILLSIALVIGTGTGLILSASNLEPEQSALTAASEHWGNHGAAIRTGDGWRLLTSLFFHASLLDLALQVGGLIWLGARLQRVLGPLVWWFAFFGAGIGGGVTAIFWHHEAIWTTGAGGAVQGLIGSAIATLLLTQRAGGKTSRTFWRDLLVFEALVVGVEWIQVSSDWGSLWGGAAVGACIGWLSWRAPQAGEELPPRVGRALVAGVFVIGVAWAVMPRFDYRPDDEQRLTRWLSEYETEEVERRNRWAELDEQYRLKAIEATAFAYETQRLIDFYRDEEKVLRDLPLETGLRSDLRRESVLVLMRERQAQALEAAQGIQEIRTLRSLAERHWQQLRNLASDPSLQTAVQRQLEAARSALVTTEVRTEWALSERGQILLEWATWETERTGLAAKVTQ